MRLIAPLTIVLLLALLGGCGDSQESSTTDPTDRAQTFAARAVQLAWERNPDCKPPPGASRWGCSIGPYRCQGVVVDQGWSISCAKPDRSISFRVQPG
jgi:hypothetical protein